MSRRGWTLLSLLALCVGTAVGYVATQDAFRTVPPAVMPPAAEGVETFVRDLDHPEARWSALWRLRELGPEALPALPRLVELLRSEEPLTRRLAAEALGRMGPVAARAQDALRTAWDASEDKELDFAIEGAMERIGGWTCFPHEMPEAVTFLEHPFLRVVVEAHRRTWLKGEDAGIAARAWRQTQEHARRLFGDRLYRLGDQARARLLTTSAFRRFEFESRWSPPFLICASQARKAPDANAAPESTPPSLAALAEEPRHFAGLLEAGSDVAQAVYRQMLADHGATLGLRPLENEYGGRPELAANVRSFRDGFPIVLWVWAGKDTFHIDVSSREDDWIERVTSLARAGTLTWMPGDGDLPAQVSARDGSGSRESADLDMLALGTAASLLEAFARQSSRWSRLEVSHDPVSVGFCASYAGWTRGAAGGLQRKTADLFFRGDIRELAREFGARGRTLPWIPLAEHLFMRRPGDHLDWAGRVHLPPSLGREIHRAQSLGLSEFLGASPDPARRAAWTEGLKSVLAGESPAPAVRRALGLGDEERAEALDAEFHAYLRARVGPVSALVAPGR